MTMTMESATAERTAPRMLWLDLTRTCQLACSHCYNSSGPDGGHGTMTGQDWTRVLNEAAGYGIEKIQLIGGEPTLHPEAADLVDQALTLGLQVEIFSNLVHIPSLWWQVFQRAGVSLATSYYSDQAEEHNTITGRQSHRHTRANIERAVGLGVPIRVGIIDAGDGQRVEEARRDLEALGVTRIRVDRVRGFGRAAQGRAPDPSQLCGNCGDGKAAISPDGEVSPCVFTSDWMRVGNVQETPLATILGGGAMTEANTSIRAAARSGGCDPDEECSPGTPASECNPKS